MSVIESLHLFSLSLRLHFFLYLVISVSSSLPLSHTHSLPLFLSHSLYSISLILSISLLLSLFLCFSSYFSISLSISLAPCLCRFVFVSYCLLQFIQWIGFVVTACFLAACAGSHDALLNPNSVQEVDGFRTYFTVSKGEVSA